MGTRARRPRLARAPPACRGSAGERSSTPSRRVVAHAGLPERHARTPRGRCHVSSRSSRSSRCLDCRDPRMSSARVREARARGSAASAPLSECPTTSTRGGGFARFFDSSSAARERPVGGGAPPLRRGGPVRRGVPPPARARVAHRLRRLRPPLLARHAVHLALAQQTAHRRRRGAAETHHDPVRGAQPEHRRAVTPPNARGFSGFSLSARRSSTRATAAADASGVKNAGLRAPSPGSGSSHSAGSAGVSSRSARARGRRRVGGDERARTPGGWRNPRRCRRARGPRTRAGRRSSTPASRACPKRERPAWRFRRAREATGKRAAERLKVLEVGRSATERHDVSLAGAAAGAVPTGGRARAREETRAPRRSEGR